MLYYRRARIELDRIPFYDIASFTVRDCRAFYWKVLFSLFKSCWNTWIKSIRYIYYYIVDTCAHIWICTLWSQSCSEFYWKGCVQFNRSVLLRLYAYMCIHPDKSIWQYWFVYCERSANLCTGRQYIVTYTDMHACIELGIWDQIGGCALMHGYLLFTARSVQSNRFFPRVSFSIQSGVIEIWV